MERSIIKIMPDYECSPLWLIGKGVVENVSTNELNLSEPLRERISIWQKKYDETLNRHNPSVSGFINKSDEEGFEAEGREIWKQMVNELKGMYDVKYFSLMDNKLY